MTSTTAATKGIACQKTMTVPEAGEIFFNLSRNASYSAAKAGVIPTIKIGRLLRVPVAKLEKMVGAE